MTPLGAVALGLLLVLLDLRVPGLDVLADPVGWLLVVRGLGGLALLDARFATVRLAAVAAGVLSLADLVHPVETASRTSGSMAAATTAAVAPQGIQGWLVLAYAAATVVVAVLLSLRLRARAAEHGDTSRARRFSWFAGWHLVAGVLLVLGGLAAQALVGPGTVAEVGAAAPLVLLVVVLALAVEVAFLLTLSRARFAAWALPDEPTRDRAPTG